MTSIYFSCTFLKQPDNPYVVYSCLGVFYFFKSKKIKGDWITYIYFILNGMFRIFFILLNTKEIFDLGFFHFCIHRSEKNVIRSLKAWITQSKSVLCHWTIILHFVVWKYLKFIHAWSSLFESRKAMKEATCQHVNKRRLENQYQFFHSSSSSGCIIYNSYS